MPDSLGLLLLSEAVLLCGTACPELPLLLLSGAGALTRVAGWLAGLEGSVLCSLAGWLDDLEGSGLFTVAGEEFLLSGAGTCSRTD